MFVKRPVDRVKTGSGVGFRQIIYILIGIRQIRIDFIGRGKCESLVVFFSLIGNGWFLCDAIGEVLDRLCSQGISQEDDICCVGTFIRREFATELFTKDGDEISTGGVGYKVSHFYLSVDEYIHDVVHDDHLSERFCLCEEILLQVIAEVCKDAFQEIVCTYERRHIITWGKRDRHFTNIFSSLHGIIEVTVSPFAIWVKSGECRDIDELIFIIFPHPYFFRFKCFFFSKCIEHLIVKPCFKTRVIGDQCREDGVVRIGVCAQGATELNAFFNSVDACDEFIFEDILQLHFLYARIEGAVVDIESC